MNYLSVCSGIEAATVAWHDLGWNPLGFSEIEKFPSEVLAYHYPNTPNLGDMTKYKEWDFGTNRLDLLVGGTPCQSFSVAGLRKGLDDPRGNLALTYVGILDKFRPKWCLWENVPGVLSSGGGRDFGAFLGALGELGYGWAYRVLDAQYFGVPQRRRRVFVVGCFGNWESAAKVLFESESLRRDIKKGRSKKQETAAFTPSSFGQYSEGVGTLRSAGGDLGGGSETLYVPETGKCLTTRIRNDYETENFVVFEPRSPDGVPRIHGNLCPTLNTMQGGQRQPCIALAENTIGRQPLNGGNGDGFTKNGPMYTLNATGVHGVAYSFDSLASNSMKSANPHSGCREVDLAKTIDTTDPSPSKNQGGIGILQNMAVRKLTPIECERLQGFPDNYTNIKENCPDGPRYKALGNSMAVPVMKWIGKGLLMFDQFWKHYPRKVAKRAALGVFNRLTKDEQALAVEAIEDHVAYWKLKGTEMDFIPHPSTWLNQGRFEDELDMTPKEVKRPSLPWYSNDELTLAKGRELGLNAYAGESMGQYRQRIQQHIGKLAV